MSEPSRGKVLLVDDDRDLLRLLALRLGTAGYTTESAANARQALSRLATFQPSLVITDLRMQGMDGLALFDAIRERNPALPVIILTAHGTIPDAVAAMQRGISGYLTKPFGSRELLEQVEKLMRLGAEGAELTAEGAEAQWRKDIVGQGLAMEALLEQAKLVARSDANILIAGQSGTGKELLAKAIHHASPRAPQPFIPINCSAIPETLLESELFGHAKGSFTGATQSHKGLFQAANGGTLFLDEVGDMPLAAQAKLLRVLEEREVRAVGAVQTVAIDVRVIAATHHDLERAVETREFREDLYYRLNVVMLELPPLGERREDIPLLVNRFLESVRKRGCEHVTGFAPDAMERLVTAPWPGNVRQLRNVVEQCAVLSPSPIIPDQLVARALRQRPRELLSLVEARDRFELDYLTQVLQITGGNVAQASRLAGRNRSEFYKLLHRHGLDPTLFRPPSD
jgi:two-component system response regulator GlrR